MIDWEEIIRAESVEELKSAKLWLFQEKMRLENERKELDILNRRMVQERKRLKEENLFFEKKMAILQDGFRQLDEDRQRLDQDKRLFAQERAARNQVRENPRYISDNVAETLFRNATNPLALRKRYRDLVKIFHPDNLFGDEELVQQINKEFAKRRREE